MKKQQPLSDKQTPLTAAKYLATLLDCSPRQLARMVPGGELPEIMDQAWDLASDISYCFETNSFDQQILDRMLELSMCSGRPVNKNEIQSFLIFVDDLQMKEQEVSLRQPVE